MQGVSETLLHQVCKHEHPIVCSHHDLLLSRMNQPSSPNPLFSSVSLAPRIPNERAKIKWCDDGIAAYQEVIGNNLDELADRWCHPDSSPSISILLSATYSLLHTAAISTNLFADLGKKTKPKPSKNPHLLSLRKSVLGIHREKKSVLSFSNPTPLINPHIISNSCPNSNSNTTSVQGRQPSREVLDYIL